MCTVSTTAAPCHQDLTRMKKKKQQKAKLIHFWTNMLMWSLSPSPPTQLQTSPRFICKVQWLSQSHLKGRKKQNHLNCIIHLITHIQLKIVSYTVLRLPVNKSNNLTISVPTKLRILAKNSPKLYILSSEDSTTVKKIKLDVSSFPAAPYAKGLTVISFGWFSRWNSPDRPGYDPQTTSNGLYLQCQPSLPVITTNITKFNVYQFLLLVLSHI